HLVVDGRTGLGVGDVSPSDVAAVETFGADREEHLLAPVDEIVVVRRRERGIPHLENPDEVQPAPDTALQGLVGGDAAVVGATWLGSEFDLLCHLGCCRRGPYAQ